LYFVSKGKPADPVIVGFLKWILTEGQKFVEEAGYVQLANQKIDSELNKLNP
jgi:phosphate transport system substrate-binding protein